ncbi:MAG: 16S rRNA (guanine(966)-N(2))-methyltransferase RsmD [Clostridia bacterium]|nr:16S rRNA (guanine(966)-N(2))-methyltransferase RsmD [Clostridia bacterium]
MRIIAGKANRKALVTLPGEEITRPTIERVKEGMFSAIQFEIQGRRVLDLFSGCGQIALEALSRGAENAVMIDSSVEAVEILKQNAKSTGLMKQCRISRMDYSEFLKGASGKEKFDLVFLDPPYSKDMKNEILKKVTRADILNDGAIVVCETNVDFCNDEDLYNLTFRKKYSYGKVFITMFNYFENKLQENAGEENE